jgi:putative ABC transport system substrate-binding protein
MKLRFPYVLILAASLLIACGSLSDSWAQQQIPRVGVFHLGPKDAERWSDEPFLRALGSHGWIEGKSVAFAHATLDDPSRYPEAVAELVRLKVDVILADSAPAVRAAFAATRTIPIVAQDFTTDPVAEGYAENYGRPGKNVTGTFLDAPEFSGKWLELLKAMIPGLSRAAVLWDPSPGDTHLRALRGIASSLGLQLQVLEVRKPGDIDAATSAFRGRPQALIILPSPMMYVESRRLADLAARLRLPATSMARAFADEGGLVSYGPDLASTYERSAALVGRILLGAKPGELPIERPTKITLVVNLKAAKSLGLTIPESVLARADKVIR